MNAHTAEHRQTAPDAFQATDPLLPDILLLHAKWRARKDAVICGDERWDWATLGAHLCQTAHGLAGLGVEKGDRVGVVMSNGLPMLEALLGIMVAGAISVPINLSVNDEAVAAMLHDAGVTAIIVTPDQMDRIDPVFRERCVCLVAGPDQPGWLGMDRFRAQPVHRPDVILNPDDGLNIIYSSGTTGMPKGIYHTHRTRRDWATDLALALRYHSAARGLVTIGLYSNVSWVTMLCTLLAGGTLVIELQFDHQRFLALVARERITHTSMVPVQYQRVIEAMENSRSDAGSADVRSMQAMMSCGSPLHEELKRQVFDHFPCGVIELYGLTEGVITTLDPEDAEGRWASVGRPLHGTDLMLIDEAGQEVPDSQAGEIVSRGRITMPGYWGRPEANAESIWYDAAGRAWFRTGDIGRFDDDGFLYIVDRKKDMILSGGQNVYPQDIEAVLVQHDVVSDAAVIGVASRRWGETPLGLVVLRQPVDAGALLVWANKRLGRQQRLADIKVVDRLPRNPNGKILKRELRDDWKDVTYD